MSLNVLPPIDDGSSFPVLQVSTDRYVIGIRERFIEWTGAGSSLLTLPDPTGHFNFYYIFNNGLGSINVEVDNSGTIMGNLSTSLPLGYGVYFKSNGLEFMMLKGSFTL